MATRSARKDLKEPTTIVVADVRPISKDLAVVSYLDQNSVRKDDLYNVATVEIMGVLLGVWAGDKVEAVIAPDASSDQDGHPELISARIIESK